jgi:hypothetical protein
MPLVLWPRDKGLRTWPFDMPLVLWPRDKGLRTWPFDMLRTWPFDVFLLFSEDRGFSLRL